MVNKNPKYITGKWYYDLPTKQQRYDRTDGTNDKFCSGLDGSENTPCTHLIYKDGWRYLILPESKTCCKCCDAKHGCGILRNDWFVSGEFISQQVAPNGETTYTYFATPDDPNYITEDS